MKLKTFGLSGAMLTVALCFCFAACTNTGEKDSLSGLANEKCSNRDLGLAEYGDYVYFVGKTMKLNSDGSSSIVMRCERDGSNLVQLGDTAKYTGIISKTEPDVRMAEPRHLESISGGRLYIRFAVTFKGISGDNKGYNSDPVEMICDLDRNGNDLHFNTKYDDPNPTGVVSCPEDSASDGYWTYYSVIDEVNDSESKIYREKIDRTGKEIFCEGHAENLQIRDGWLFFASYATGEGTISCINLKSGIKKDIYVYYFREHNIGNINLCGNWIYFVDYAAGGHLCRIRTDGTGLSVISGKPIIQYVIFGHTIMYQGWESPEDGKFVLAEEEGINHLYRMDLDGSNIQTIT
ncbi:MAG: DUF5050 domain-containing protein [Eubacteriales bacterium]